jgi:hypothetical protein
MAAKRLHGQETEDRLAFICSTHVHPVASASIDVDDICSGRFDAAADKVSVLARALALEQSPQCRAEILAALARCAPLGCPVTIASAIKHCQDNDLNVQLAAVEVLTHTARKGDKNAVVTLVGLITGSIFKDPTQPGAFLNARDPGKNSLANMPRRPGDHSFRQSVKLRVAAVRALAAMCTESDLRVRELFLPPRLCPARCPACLLLCDRMRAEHAAHERRWRFAYVTWPRKTSIRVCGPPP